MAFDAEAMASALAPMTFVVEARSFAVDDPSSVVDDRTFVGEAMAFVLEAMTFVAGDALHTPSITQTKAPRADLCDVGGLNPLFPIAHCPFPTPHCPPPALFSEP